TCTGWPLIPPVVLTDFAHAWITVLVAPSDPACGPEQLQIMPSLIGAPVAGVVDVDAAVVVDAVVADGVVVEAGLVTALVAGDTDFECDELEPQALTPTALAHAISSAPRARALITISLSLCISGSVQAHDLAPRAIDAEAVPTVEM